MYLIVGKEKIEKEFLYDYIFDKEFCSNHHFNEYEVTEEFIKKAKQSNIYQFYVFNKKRKSFIGLLGFKLIRLIKKLEKAVFSNKLKGGKNGIFNKKRY